MLAIKWAREQKVPFLGICLGFQLAVIEWARSICSIGGASSLLASQYPCHAHPVQRRHLASSMSRPSTRLSSLCRRSRGRTWAARCVSVCARPSSSRAPSSGARCASSTAAQRRSGSATATGTRSTQSTSRNSPRAGSRLSARTRRASGCRCLSCQVRVCRHLKWWQEC